MVLGGDGGGSSWGTSKNLVDAKEVLAPRKSPESQSKRAADDPLDAANVPVLVEAYLREGGTVPLDVLVAEVEAMQQAATRLRVNAEKCDKQ